MMTWDIGKIAAVFVVAGLSFTATADIALGQTTLQDLEAIDNPSVDINELIRLTKLVIKETCEEIEEFKLQRDFADDELAQFQQQIDAIDKKKDENWQTHEDISQQIIDSRNLTTVAQLQDDPDLQRARADKERVDAALDAEKEVILSSDAYLSSVRSRAGAQNGINSSGIYKSRMEERLTELENIRDLNPESIIAKPDGTPDPTPKPPGVPDVEVPQREAESDPEFRLRFDISKPGPIDHTFETFNQRLLTQDELGLGIDLGISPIFGDRNFVSVDIMTMPGDYNGHENLPGGAVGASSGSFRHNYFGLSGTAEWDMPDERFNFGLTAGAGALNSRGDGTFEFKGTQAAVKLGGYVTYDTNGGMI